jgi:hypothetical protein
LFAQIRDSLGSGAFDKLIDFSYCFCFWFSLPLAIWLSNSRIGLALHWQAVRKAACQSTSLSKKPDPTLGEALLRKGTQYVPSTRAT